MSSLVSRFHFAQRRHSIFFLLAAVVLWFLLYLPLEAVSKTIVAWLPLDPAGRLAGALQFFLYDTPKVLLLLTGVVFLMGIVHTFISPQRTRALLAGRRQGIGNVLAANLGIVTPFCSCSAVPLFIGFLQAGVPMGVTFSFLIAAPMVNEIALAMLLGLFGVKIAGLYLGLGLAVAIVAGMIIGKLDMQSGLEDWVRTLQKAPAAAVVVDDDKPDWSMRVHSGLDHVREIVGRVWPYIVVGVALGAGIHGYVPQNFMASIMGRNT